MQKFGSSGLFEEKNQSSKSSQSEKIHFTQDKKVYSASCSVDEGLKRKFDAPTDNPAEFEGFQPVFEKYLIQKRLGSGSYGEVVLAQDRYTG